MSYSFGTIRSKGVYKKLCNRKRGGFKNRIWNTHSSKDSISHFSWLVLQVRWVLIVFPWILELVVLHSIGSGDYITVHTDTSFIIFVWLSNWIKNMFFKFSMTSDWKKDWKIICRHRNYRSCKPESGPKKLNIWQDFWNS